MKYNGTIYRPPLEANTFLVPITEGCTHNSCAFCNMYRGVPFHMLPLDEVEAYLRETAARLGAYAERITRVYLVGADPFALSANRLLERIVLDYWAIHPLDSVGIEGLLGTNKNRMLNTLEKAIEEVDESAYRRVSRTGTL